MTELEAVKILAGVLNGKSLSAYKLEQPKLKAICFGVCRWYFQLDGLLNQFLKKPFKQKDTDIKVLLLIALFQLSHMRKPDHAVVNDAVKTAEKLNKLWAKGLINAVLRNVIRSEKPDLKADEANYAHPSWFIKTVKKVWPEQWKTILIENNKQAPLTLRVNKTQTTRDAFLKKLPTAQATQVSGDGVLLQTAVSVSEIPGFFEGSCSVQDEAAQLAVDFLALKPGQRVLDACAAPGGKCTHIIEHEPNITELVAIDNDSSRLKRVDDNLQRLKLSATVICADVIDTASWWDKNPFDRILLDAPCSATGVIRRHPDIKLLRREKDITQLTKTQLKMLNTLWPLLKTNGILVYATCSIFPQENHQIIRSFLAQNNTANIQKEQQILPGENNMDGFYYCSLLKSAPPYLGSDPK